MLLATLLATVCVISPGPDGKLDEELRTGTEFRPIFVRFEDQLFQKGGAFEQFCRQNEASSRELNRKRVLEGLRSRAEKTWNSASAAVDELVRKGDIRVVTRFWIVNGFACDALPRACEALASRPDVAYVYLQRQPGNSRQHRSEPGPHPLEGTNWNATKIVAERSPQKGDAEKAELPWNLTKIKADLAWAEGATGKGIVVAINDGGFDDIPALRPALWRNAKETLNGKDDDGNGYVDDVFGYDFQLQSGLTFGGTGLFHGTMCAGIVAGQKVAGQPLATGIAPNAKLMMLNGMGSLKVLEYALANGADVLSMSWMWVNLEMGHYRGVFRLALEHMAAGGVVPVGGAGNFATSAPPGKQIANPKDIPCCIAVAGIMADGKRPNFSSMGPVSWTGVKFYDDHPTLAKPDLTAPNGEFPVWGFGEPPRAEWKVLWKGEADDRLLVGPRGNSFAGPHAAGAAALVLSANPKLNSWQVKRILEETCSDLGEPGWDKESGAGLIDAQKAVQKAKSMR